MLFLLNLYFLVVLFKNLFNFFVWKIKFFLLKMFFVNWWKKCGILFFNIFFLMFNIDVFELIIFVSGSKFNLLLFVL